MCQAARIETWLDPMRARLSLLVPFLAALFNADVGWAGEWRVERISGTAWTIESIEKRTALKVGMLVPEGLTIATAKSGRVRLSSENNIMTLGPGSVAVVRPQHGFSSKTEVLQRIGSIEFDIEKRSAPHFTVQTPYMAAVVKGTSFTISVSKTDAKIGVERGLVQVRDIQTGETAGVSAGQRASVSTSAPGLVTAGINAAAVTAGKPSAPSVAPVGQSLGSFRSEQAAMSGSAASRSAGRAEAASPASDTGIASSRSAESSGFGGFGGDSNDRNNSGIVSTSAGPNGGASETSSRSGESDSRGGEKSDAGTNSNGGFGGNGGLSGNNGGGNGNGNNGNGNGNGGPSGNSGGGNG
ncbi:FecR domain-containing protein, partial [Aureimonas ureilytica]|uniref:FecR domain-containing protein n=2 Tax=Aureimonas ureilytica TaxID=401562 RepID=UPI0012DEB1BB